MTPDQFHWKMGYISGMFDADTERKYKRMIECMIDALISLGYEEGVKYFRKVEEERDREMSEV